MFLLNQNPGYRKPLDPADAETLGVQGADEVERFLSWRGNVPTPLHSLPALAAELGLGAIHLKDEGFRLGLGSFKALGGAYAVVRLVLEEATRQLGRPVDLDELSSPRVRAVAEGMTVTCATDGNHGGRWRRRAIGRRQGGIFVHGGVARTAWRRSRAWCADDPRRRHL